MPGKRDALERQADAPTDLHVENRKGDRDAGLALDHLVEVAVARVVILVGIAAVAEIVEQELVQRHDTLLGGRALRHARAQAHGEALDLAEVALDVEARISVLRDHQAGARKIEMRVLACHQLLKRIERDHAPRREKCLGRKPSARSVPP